MDEYLTTGPSLRRTDRPTVANAERRDPMALGDAERQELFETFMEHQRRYQRVWAKLKYGIDYDRMSDRDRTILAKDYALAHIDEILEWMRQQDWKSHRYVDVAVDRAKVIEELVDVGKFWINELLLFRITVPELRKAWLEKTQRVEERLKTEVGSVINELGGMIK